MMTQNILINLSIISKIKPNDKVFINNEHYISIEYDSIFQGLFRFFYNNSRIKTINHLNDFYNNVFTYVNELINSKYLNKQSNIKKYIKQTKLHDKNECCNINDHLEYYSELETEHFNKIFNELFEMQNYLKLSINGLNNLKQTYINDNLTISKIDIIVNSIESNIDKIGRKISSLEKNNIDLHNFHIKSRND